MRWEIAPSHIQVLPNHDVLIMPLRSTNIEIATEKRSHLSMLQINGLARIIYYYHVSSEVVSSSSSLAKILQPNAERRIARFNVRAFRVLHNLSHVQFLSPKVQIIKTCMTDR